jgi:hypothetical protein
MDRGEKASVGKAGGASAIDALNADNDVRTVLVQASGGLVVTVGEVTAFIEIGLTRGGHR